jgi:hypothetical protein
MGRYRPRRGDGQPFRSGRAVAARKLAHDCIANDVTRLRAHDSELAHSDRTLGGAESSPVTLPKHPRSCAPHARPAIGDAEGVSRHCGSRL